MPRITNLKTGIQITYYLARVNEKSFLFQFSLSNIFFFLKCVGMLPCLHGEIDYLHYY